MAMMWFAAIPSTTPYDTATQGNGATKFYPSAGPYYVTEADATGSIITKLQKNPNYTPPGSLTPRDRATNEIDFTAFGSQQSCLDNTESGNQDVDFCGMRAAQAAQALTDLGQPHSVTGVASTTQGGGGQYHAEQTSCVDYLALDTQHAPTSNVNVRKALNYIIDRQALIDKLGAYAGVPSDNLLTPQVPGYAKYTVYPNSPNPTKGNNVASGGLNNKKIRIWNATSGARRDQSGVIADDLQYMNDHFGTNMNIAHFDSDGGDSSQYYTILGTYPTATNDAQSNAHFGQDAFNIARAGWCADYYDPFDYLNVLLDGGLIHGTTASPESGNVNLAYFNQNSVNTQLRAAATKVGTARRQAYQSLDKSIMTNSAPWIPFELDNARIVLSSRVAAHGGYSYNEFMGTPSLNTLHVN